VIDLHVQGQLALAIDEQRKDVEHRAQIDLVYRHQHERGVGGLHDVMGADHSAASVLDGALAQLPQQGLQTQPQVRRQRRAGHPGPRNEAQVDLVGTRVHRIPRVTHPGGAFLQIDASQLDLAGHVGLGLRDLDLAALQHPAVPLVLEVFLVRDEVGELLVEAQHHVDGLR
jgi:hypothetical protein